MLTEYVTQPLREIEYLSLFRRAFNEMAPSHFDAAVAYATLSGAEVLESTLTSFPTWTRCRKRWLVGIDWCRSEPLALERLSGMPSSQVRVPDGAVVVVRRGCVPLIPFHPKVFILRSREAFAIISGSGNLSRSGLTRGHECGSLVLFKEPIAPAEERLKDGMAHLKTWFASAWRAGTPLTDIVDDYRSQVECGENLRSPVPTDDDAADTERVAPAVRGRRALPPDRLRQLRVARQLWMEAGTLSRNRGPDIPGNQLMMSPMTRVFFGVPAMDVPQNTHLCHITIHHGTVSRDDCSLRFSHNSMDVLGLPIPGEGGPPTYDDMTLHFERRANGTFDLIVGRGRDRARWRARSKRVGGAFRMTSGREWGVY